MLFFVSFFIKKNTVYDVNVVNFSFFYENVKIKFFKDFFVTKYHMIEFLLYLKKTLFN